MKILSVLFADDFVTHSLNRFYIEGFVNLLLVDLTQCIRCPATNFHTGVYTGFKARKDWSG